MTRWSDAAQHRKRPARLAADALAVAYMTAHPGAHRLEIAAYLKAQRIPSKLAETTARHITSRGKSYD